MGGIEALGVLDRGILDAIRAGKRHFVEIQVFVGRGFSMREVDRSLQRLRRKGLIEHLWGGDYGWRVRGR